MKKNIYNFIIVLFISIGLVFSNSFAYNLTKKDEIILKAFNNKIDEIYNKNPKKVNNFYLLLKKIRSKKQKDSRVFVLLSKIIEHINFLLENEKQLKNNIFQKNIEKNKKELEQERKIQEERKKRELERIRKQEELTRKLEKQRQERLEQERKIQEEKQKYENNYNYYIRKGRTKVYKDCQIGPRGGRYYINSHGRKVYNCD